VSPELSQLIELQELDVELQKVTDKLSRIPLERDQAESDFRQYAAEFLALQSRHQETLDHRKRLETELATTQEHHEKYSQDKMRVTNEREYKAVLLEIDTATKRITAIEAEILKQMEELEKLDADLKVCAPDVDKKRSEFNLALETLDVEIEADNRQLAELQKRREELAARIPRALFDSYDRMTRLRRGQALAEVRSGICTACRMKVRPKVMSDVRKGDQLITCESCGRILYIRQQSAPAGEIAMSQQGVTER
jgi:uncharacterized protein